jgi:hypothetical protein
MSANGESAKRELIGFIIKALREHEQEIDQLLLRLDDAKAKQTGINQKLNGKAAYIEEKLTLLKDNLEKLKVFTDPPQDSTSPDPDPPAEANNTVDLSNQSGEASVVVKCLWWEDFQNLAVKADWVTFMLDDGEKTFQVEALKAGRLMTYRGNAPVEVDLLKQWLIKDLEISSKGKVLSGSMKLNHLN